MAELIGERLKRKRSKGIDFSDIIIAEWPHADDFIARIYPRLRWIYTWWFTLVALAIPPMVTNSYAGLRGVDEDLRDAARGMGMTGRQSLLRVELPVAVPLVLLVVLLMLVLLLRALVAPLFLLAAVVLSFLGSVGLSLAVIHATALPRGAATRSLANGALMTWSSVKRCPLAASANDAAIVRARSDDLMNDIGGDGGRREMR